MERGRGEKTRVGEVMIKYKTRSTKCGVQAEIVEVEISRETDRSVWLPGGRIERKMCDYHLYHDTWQDANDYLLRIADEQVDIAQNKLERARRRRAEVLAMREPGTQS